MIKQLRTTNRRPVPVKYAVVAGAIAVVSVVALELSGIALTSSYSGLGGKLVPDSGGAAEVVPASSMR